MVKGENSMMDSCVHRTLLLFFILLIKAYQGCYYRISTSPTEAIAGEDLNLICNTECENLAFEQLDRYKSVCGIKTENCALVNCIDTYTYFCDGKNYTLKINGSLVNNVLHGTKWQCTDPIGPLSSQPLTLYINVPITEVTLMVVSMDSDAVRVVNGSRQNLTCTTDAGRPSSRITWHLDNINLTSLVIDQPDSCDNKVFGPMCISSSVLTYTGNMADDGKNIFCTASNIERKGFVTSTKVPVEILYGPEIVFISPNITSYTVNETESIGPIACDADCRPVCNITWKGTNFPRVAKSTLNLINIDRSLTGDYRCTASNIASNKSSVTIHVNVNYGPRFANLSTSSRHYTVNETGSIGPINCTSDCKPNCRFIWSGPHLLSSYNSVLNIVNIRKEQAGDYVCTAENVFGFAKSQNVTVNVNYGPVKATLYPSNERYIVNETGNVGPINCSAICYPQCEITWIYPNVSSIARPVLYVQNISRTQAGNYHCTARNILGSTASNTVNIVVNYGPRKVDILPQNSAYTVNETSDVTVITCSALCEPRCLLKWSGPHLPNNTKDVLNLMNISRNQAGFYHCTAQNFLGISISNTVNVTVNYGPTSALIYPPKHSYTVNETEHFGPINCTADCKPDCKMTWSGPDYSNDLLSLLTIRHINRSQAGDYQCKASNNVGSVTSAVIKLIVNYHPFILGLSENKTVLENQTFSLYCQYQSVPKAQIIWKFNDNALEDEDVNVDTTPNTNLSMLTFTRIKCFSMGIYTCEAVNIIGNDSKYYSLNVNCPPRINSMEHIVQDRIAISDDEPIDVTLHIIAFPKPQISWKFFRNGITTNIDKGITNKGYGNRFQSNLLILNVTKEHFGDYLIYGYNGIGNTERFIHLYHIIAARIPDIPENVTCKGKTKDVVIHWKPGFNGGAAQDFNVYYKLNDDDSFRKYDNDYNDTEEEEYISAQILTLQSSSTYILKICARNIHGNSTSENVYCNTTKLDELNELNDNLTIIAAGTGIGLAFIFVAVVVVLVWLKKHRTDGNKGNNDVLINRRQQDNTQLNDAFDDDCLKDNILYESSGPDFHVKNPPAGSEYAVVQKSCGIHETNLHEEDGPNTNKYEGGKGTKKLQTCNNSTPKGNASNEEVYQNISATTNETRTKRRKTNKHGLVYADIVFSGDNKKREFFIHGLENRTNYADIDFSLKADPLPSDESDNDEEKHSKRSKTED